MTLNVIHHPITLADAIRAPRLHHQALPDELAHESNGLSPQAADSLRTLGHRLRDAGRMVNVNAVMRVGGGWEGVHEPRGAGGAVGY